MGTKLDNIGFKKKSTTVIPNNLSPVAKKQDNLKIQRNISLKKSRE
jgi:hypothetical protein